MTSEKLRVARNLAEDMEHDIGELIQDELGYLAEALEDASGKLSEAIKGEDVDDGIDAFHALDASMSDTRDMVVRLNYHRELMQAILRTLGEEE